jgi:polar amino acid transport system ATP-binding protein
VTPLVEILDVHKSFGAHEVLRGITLSVEAHEVVCLIGASGSGKSTLLRCVNALEHIDAGTIRLAGDVVSCEGTDYVRLRRQVGIVFQSYNLFPHMNVLRNVTLAPTKALGVKKADAEEQAMALLSRVGLAEKARSYPDQLSGGQQQRVAIARAMAVNPRVLLLDEITSALDPELVNEVLEMVRDLAVSGMTMILATHEMNFAREVAHKVCFLHQGAILEQGKPEEIFESPVEDRTRAFIGRTLQAGRPKEALR